MAASPLTAVAALLGLQAGSQTAAASDMQKSVCLIDFIYLLLVDYF
jgi:hypothetical protein